MPICISNRYGDRAVNPGGERGADGRYIRPLVDVGARFDGPLVDLGSK